MDKCIREGCNGKVLSDTCYMCGHEAEPKVSSTALPRPYYNRFTGYNVGPVKTYGREYHAVGWFIP